jgi:hypothetical protein
MFHPGLYLFSAVICARRSFWLPVLVVGILVVKLCWVLMFYYWKYNIHCLHICKLSLRTENLHCSSVMSKQHSTKKKSKYVSIFWLPRKQSNLGVVTGF